MSFQDDPETIRWRIHLKSPPTAVYSALSTDAGRASFWAESAVEHDGVIRFVFPNNQVWDGRILESIPPTRFELIYIGNSNVTFELGDDGQGGTELALTDSGVSLEDRTEVIAGWVSVLMNLKSVVDHGLDLRGHDAARHWDTGYAEN